MAYITTITSDRTVSSLQHVIYYGHNTTPSTLPPSTNIGVQRVKPVGKRFLKTFPGPKGLKIFPGRVKRVEIRVRMG